MNRLTLLLMTFLLSIPYAHSQSAVPLTQQVVEHHIQSGNNRDLEAVMSDYADDAILIAPGGVLYKGKPEIQTSFEQLLAQDGGSIITADQKVFEAEVGYIVWTMNAGQPGAAHGSDTFIVHNGKIVVQTVTIFQPGQD